MWTDEAVAALMHLYLHIGAAKCGSTSIQRLLNLSRLQLEDCGFFQLSCWGEDQAWKLAVSQLSEEAKLYWVHKRRMLDETELQRVVSKLKEQTASEIRTLEKANVQKVVASSEFIYGNNVSAQDIESLYSFLTTFFSEVTIIFYCRNQVELVKSLWTQAVKGPTRNTTSFRHFVERITEDDYHFNFNRYIPIWASIFGGDCLRVNTLHSDNLQGGTLTRDFCSILGVPEESVAELESDDRRSNPSPNYSTTRIMRLSNIAQQLALPAGARRLSSALFRRAEYYSQKWLDTPMPGDHDARIRTLFRSDNEDFNRRFLTGKNVQLDCQ